MADRHSEKIEENGSSPLDEFQTSDPEGVLSVRYGVRDDGSPYEFSEILSGIEVCILVLGSDRKIRRFTPSAERLLGLVVEDVGRPVSASRIAVQVRGLEGLISAALQKGREASREIQDESGRSFLLQIEPLRATDASIDGVLMAFVDIHELRLRQEATERDKNFISAILNAAKDLLVVILDRQGRIVHFNAVCQRATGYSAEEVRGRCVWDFLIAPEEVDSVKATFQAVVSGTANKRENSWIAKNGRRLLISWSNRVVLGNGGVESVIATGIDVSEREEAKRRAEQSEETVRALLETAAQAILACDRDGRIQLANVAAERMFGYPRAHLLGQPLECLIPEGYRTRHARHRAAWFEQPHNRPMGIGLDLIGLRKDGSTFPIEVSLSFIGTSHGLLGVAFVSDITERKKNDRTLQEYRDQLQQLTGALIEAQERGNRMLARELHDVFSQELAAVGMEISSLKDRLKTNRDVAGRLSDLGKKIGHLSAGIHRTSRELHPAVLEELGLEAAMQQECEAFEQRTGVVTQFTAKDIPTDLPMNLALCLYRVAQESLRNVQKHSRSPRVYVRLEAGDGQIALWIEDQGDGFDLDAVLRKGGLGLVSMEERVRIVNGQFTVHSQPNVGTIVTVVVPLRGKTE